MVLNAVRLALKVSNLCIHSLIIKYFTCSRVILHGPDALQCDFSTSWYGLSCDVPGFDTALLRESNTCIRPTSEVGPFERPKLYYSVFSSCCHTPGVKVFCVR